MFPENGVHLLVQPKDLEKEEFIICTQAERSRGPRVARRGEPLSTGGMQAEGAWHPPGRLSRGDGLGGRQGDQGPSSLWSSGLDHSAPEALEVQAGVEATAWLVPFLF